MLSWMQDQAGITNQWATEDRARYKDTFQPLQDQFIAEAQGYDTAERRADRANSAAADIALAARQAGDARTRQAMSMGVNPMSGRFQAETAKAATDTALATAGARNLAGQQVEQEGRSLRAQAVNLGQGLGVNPATSMGISNGAAASGFNGAMSGYGQQGSLLNTQYQNQLSAWQANQGALGSAMGGLGALAGAFLSSKDLKENKRPVDDALKAVQKMPVERWSYKDGVADGGEHVGPYAEDFKKATGVGDGKSIDPISLVGITLGAVQELGAKVDRLERAAPKAQPKRKPVAMGVAA